MTQKPKIIFSSYAQKSGFSPFKMKISKSPKIIFSIQVYSSHLKFLYHGVIFRQVTFKNLNIWKFSDFPPNTLPLTVGNSDIKITFSVIKFSVQVSNFITLK